ncbi:MAG: sensor histidine kinase, partial [Chitinophagaceae bacterium]
MEIARPFDKLITVLAHVLMWGLFAIAMFYYHPLFSGVNISLRSWIIQCFTLLVLIIVFYFNTNFLVPRFLLKNRVILFFCFIIILIIATTVTIGWADRTLELTKRYRQYADVRMLLPSPFERSRRLERPTIILVILVLGIGTTVAVIQHWQKDKEKREQLEKEKIATELSFLKAQINPHFFFNTLNNIYALTAVDPVAAGSAIHQLSRMMRYLLDGTQPSQTMLSNEIAFIKDYISLMQLRLTDVVSINVDIPTDLVDLPLSPMLFLPFVENAFKHGVSPTKKSYIDVVIKQKDSRIELIVRNSVFEQQYGSLETGNGIGLLNTRRRLDLIYPGKYKLR